MTLKIGSENTKMSKVNLYLNVFKMRSAEGSNQMNSCITFFIVIEYKSQYQLNKL